MSKLHKQRILDPAAELSKFEADLAKMKVGPKAAPDGTPAPPVRSRMLDKNFALDVSGFKFNQWSALLEPSQTVENALDPTFWSDQVGKIIGHNKTGGRGDIIHLRKLSTGLYVELHISEVSVGYVRVQLVGASQPPAIEIPADSPLTTRWNAGSNMHDVIRKSDNTVMQGGFQTDRAAVAWIADHLKAMAA